MSGPLDAGLWLNDLSAIRMRAGAIISVVLFNVFGVRAQQSVWGQCGGIGWSVTSCDLCLAVYLMNVSGLAQHLVYLAQSARSSMIVIYFKYFRPQQLSDRILNLEGIWVASLAMSIEM